MSWGSNEKIIKQMNDVANAQLSSGNPLQSCTKGLRSFTTARAPHGHIAIIEICLVRSHTQKIVVLWTHRNNLKGILYVSLSQKTSWTKGLNMVNSILSSGITYTTMVRGDAIIHRKTFGVR